MPSLYRLCAERVAVLVLLSNQLEALKKLYLSRLQGMDLPGLLINYITNDKTFAAANFPDILQCEDCYRVQLTRPDAIDCCACDLIIRDRAVYISTLPNLALNMMRLDIENGTYIMSGVNEGYVLQRNNSVLCSDDLAHVFSARSQHRGLTTDIEQPSVNNWQEALFDDNFARCVRNNTFYYQYPSYEACKLMLMQGVPMLNCIPVLFYLNKLINVKDLPFITLTCRTLTCRTNVKDIGNVMFCFYVYHSKYGRIGLAVQQRKFCNMYGAHVNVMWSQKCTAVGNFVVRDCSLYGASVPYVCKFNPCKCDYSFDEFVNTLK